MVKKVLAKIFIWLVLILMYAPILLLMIYSFQDSQYINLSHFGTPSFKLYGSLMEYEEIWDAFFNTLLVAVVASIVSTILGTLGAIGIFYSKKRYKTMLTNLNQIPVLNAEIITALSLTILFAQLFKVDFGFSTLLVGHVVLTVPFVVLSVIPKLQQMDPNTYEAALDLGASPNKALFSVVLPEILPGIFSGLMLSFTLSLDDYIITAFTRNDSFTTLSTYIYGVTAKGPLPAELRAFTTLFVLAVAIIIVGYNFVKGYKFNKKKVVGGR